MGTNIRPEISNKNKYWIERHRYYELKHFCLQYPTWKKAYIALEWLSGTPTDRVISSKTNVINDPTAKCAEARAYYSERIKMVEMVAVAADPTISDYILKAVTEDVSYDRLKAMTDIPCCRDVYYETYRRFFWLLNRARN